MIELITQRKMEEARFHTSVVEWQTKNLAAMFVGLAEDPQQAKQMSKMIDKMHLPLSDEADSIVDTRSYDEIHEKGALIDLDSQPSFEALSAAMNHM